MLEIFAKIIIVIIGLHFLLLAFVAMIKLFKIFIDEIKQGYYGNAFSYSLGFWACFLVFIGLAYALFIILTIGGF